MGTHLLVDIDSVNYNFDDNQDAVRDDFKTIQLNDIRLKENKPNNITEKNNKIIWAVRESDDQVINHETVFPNGFYTLEDIQIGLNNDLKFKNCPIQFLINYDRELMSKITIFKIKPPNCQIDVFLFGGSLLESLGFGTSNWLENYPLSNINPITLFPYGKYSLWVDVLDCTKNLVNGLPSKLMCYLTYPFYFKLEKKAINNRSSNISFKVLDSCNNKVNFFQFSFILNGE